MKPIFDSLIQIGQQLNIMTEDENNDNLTINVIFVICGILKFGFWLSRSADLELPPSAPWMTE
jgi:hypothetical protein